ncbi:MAG: NrdJb [Lysobacterales bacterium]|nr:NrdJb [Xanthomonadales bacterium]
MTIKINQKITGYAVQKPEDLAKAQAAEAAAAAKPVEEEQDTGAEVIHMHERVERPEMLDGSTYKIKSPLFEHALYVTINDIVLNEGTEHESRRPFEVFINSKNMDHFQWAVALTRIMSAVFRKGGDVTFIVEELKAVFDPRGGYFKSGGVYMPSIVAELGFVVEDHLKKIGMLQGDELSIEQREAIAKKRAEYDSRQGETAKKKSEVGAPAAAAEAKAALAVVPVPPPASASDSASFPPSASMCGKCSTKAVVLMDGCQTCLNCGYSKCG